MTEFRPPKEMSFSSPNTAEAWRKWELAFKTYYKAAELSKKEETTQVAILLHSAGMEAQEIFSNFVFDAEESKDKVDDVLAKFKSYCEPKKNEIFATYKFWSRDRVPGESIEKWFNDLKSLAADCNFQDQRDRHIRDKIVLSLEDHPLRERLIEQGTTLTLEKCIEVCRAAETSKARSQTMNSNNKTNAIKMVETNRTFQRSRFQATGKKPTSSAPAPQRNCRYCGRQHEPRKCPAYGKECSFCHKLNHFSSVCQSRLLSKLTGNSVKQVRDIHTDIDDDEEVLYISTIQQAQHISSTTVKIMMLNDNDEQQPIMCKLDTGADANVMSIDIYESLSLSPLQNCQTKLCGFGNSVVYPLGVTTITCLDKLKNVFALQFYVTDVFDSVILGEKACFTLNLLKRVDIVTPDAPLTLPQIHNEYADIFTSIGTYDKEYHICIQDTAEGVIQPPRKVPYAVRPRLKACLDKLTEQNIVADVDIPTDWVNNLVIVGKKNNALRLCLDPKPLNAVIKRERHVIPTPADVQAQLSGNTIFSVIDMKDAYWHVKLSESSSYLTTFHTPWGRKRFLRMPFGLSSASEVMQKRNEEIFGDLSGVHVIADDLIIAAPTEKQHDITFKAVLDRARQKNVRYNKDKIQFKVNAVEYMGNLVTHEGLKPDSKKLDAILNMPQPTDVPSLQRLSGMTKFLSQYIPNESTITAPLRTLLKKGVTWNWTGQQDEALSKLKTMLSSPPVLAFYDVTKPVTIQSDASQSGLGACLLQDGNLWPMLQDQ